jgi:hypothetical protein
MSRLVTPLPTSRRKPGRADIGVRQINCFAQGLAAATMLCGSLRAFADTGVGVDTWRGNKLDPTAGTQSETPDERGTSWLTPGTHRTPTGHLYLNPAEPPPQPDEHGDWQGYGILQLGGLATAGDDRNALWNRYVDWDSGLILGLLDYTWQHPADGTYANVRASRLSDDDQFYQAAFGRAGSYKIQAFIRDLPNVLSNNARSIWNGVGTNNLTLPSSLTPGASTPAQVAAVSAATPERQLKVKRDKQGLGYNVYLTPEWTAYANVTDEQRKGARPYGGPFFFAFALAGPPFFLADGGVNETLKPIDDSTINVNAGFRYAGNEWRMDFGYTGSFYRDANRSYTFQSPFMLSTPIIPGSVSAPLYQGQMSTEPDNNYNNLQATLTRKIPMNGEVSLSAAVGRMSQNDALIAPIDCEGVFGIGLGGSLQTGPQNPFLHNCADWNTPAALSRRNADMRIDTSMLDARIVLQPSSDISLRSGLKFNREDYRNTYLAYNPLTGQYGYISENGAQGSMIPGEVGIIDPLNNSAGPTRIRSLPLDIQTIDANIGADWKFADKNTLGATFDYNRYEPSNRERSEINDSSIKLSWLNRTLDWLTLRANYTYLKQTGNRYDYDPYAFLYSSSLPGYMAPASGTPVHTVDAERKYDMSNRDENKIDLMATVMPRDDMTLSGSLRGDRNSYDAQIGRQDYDTYGATLQWEWQPAVATSVSAYIAMDRSRLNLANVQDQPGTSTDPTLGGATYAYDGIWWLHDEQRDYYAGANFNHNFGRVKLDASWSYLYSRGTDNYRYAGSSALAYPETAPNAGPGGGAFTPMIYRTQSFNVSLTIPIDERISMRIFDYYERGHVSDWHYLGLDALRVIGNRVYTDGGPESYSTNMVGVLVNVQL